jgi:hypothetical protein
MFGHFCRKQKRAVWLRIFTFLVSWRQLTKKVKTEEKSCFGMVREYPTHQGI